jgi:hypothetical protein
MRPRELPTQLLVCTYTYDRARSPEPFDRMATIRNSRRRTPDDASHPSPVLAPMHATTPFTFPGFPS